MLTLILMTLNAGLALVLLFSSLQTLNRMTIKTKHGLRSVYVFLAVSAFYTLVDIQNTTPQILLLNLSVLYLTYKIKLPEREVTGVHRILTF